MKRIVVGSGRAGVLALLGLGLLRLLDRRADRAEGDRLEALQPPEPRFFRQDMVADLPAPARRYLSFAIGEGTPLRPVAVIEMAGRFGLGTKEAPRYQQMAAHQVLAGPEGFVWSMRTTSGLPLSGSDTGRWTRFRLLGLIPVARVGGDADHARSAFARSVAEAVIWAPAALLPGPGVTWTMVDEDTARVTVERGGLSQDVEVRVDGEGRPGTVSLDRWSNANPDKTFRLQPFGATVSDIREVGGYRLPFHVEAGNMFGTDDYFPFFIADVTDIRFPEQRP